MLDSNNFLSGGVVLVQNPDGLLGKAINDYISDAMMHGNVTGESQPMLSPVHSLLSLMTDDKNIIQLPTYESRHNGALLRNYKTIMYNPIDLSSYQVNLNTPVGGMIKPAGSVDAKSYSYLENSVAIVTSGDIAEARKYQVLLSENPDANIARYFTTLHKRGLLCLALAQVEMLLQSLTSKPYNVSLTAGGDDIYQINQNETIFSKFNFQNKFNGGAGSNGNEQVVYVDGTRKNAEPAGVASRFPRSKVSALFKAMNPILSAKSRKEIFILGPKTIAETFMEDRRGEMQWQNSGLAQQEYLKIIVNANSIVGQGTVQIDPHYNWSTNNVNQITYIAIEDFIWAKVFGKNPTVSLKEGSNANVFTLFAIAHNTLRYDVSPLVMQTYVPAATADGGIPNGVNDIFALKQKWASVVADPYGIFALEVLADGIVLDDTIPNMNLGFSKISS